MPRGIGPYFNDKISRLALLLRANVLCRGHAGVRPELVDRLLALINHRVFPMGGRSAPWVWAICSPWPNWVFV